MLSTISEYKIVPILRGMNVEDALFLTECLHQSNFNVLEVSLNQADSYTVLERLCQEFGNQMTIGAGTVLSSQMAYDARDLGASFFLSPNISKQVANTAKELDIPYIPGALTPTEIQYASELGIDVIKIFPIRQLGSSYIKDVLASLNKVKLLAVGGVGSDNLKEFLDAGAAGVGIGSSLIKEEWITNRDRRAVLEQLNIYKKVLQEKEGK